MADCIIPVTQNNANIHYDLHALAAEAVKDGQTDRETEKLCVILVRSYDPCISWSVHLEMNRSKRQESNGTFLPAQT